MGCRMERAREWSMRLLHESKLHDVNSFVTLTYDNAHLPVGGSLDLRDFQLFAKRLRAEVGPFRYFHAGEYGEQTFRPHYHAILFGVGFSGEPVQGRPGLFVSATLTEVWGKGHASYGEVTPASCSYVARYCLKKAGNDDRKSYRRLDALTGEEWFVAPEYTTMSRRPGIGRGWYRRFRSDVFPSDSIPVDGRLERPPRYYDRLLEQEQPEVFASLKAERAERGALRPRDTLSRRRAAESLARSRLSRFGGREPAS